MTDQLLAEIDRADRAAHEQDTANVSLNIAGIGASAGQPQHSSISVPKGPIIERDRERSREKKESSRENEVIASGGATGIASGRSGSLRGSSRVPQSQQSQTKNETPPLTPTHTQPSTGQPQRPLPNVPERPQPGTSRSNEPSPSYFPPMASPHAEVPHYGQSQMQTQPRDSSPPFRYDERQQSSVPPSKAKTPDRSLPVQEENEAEEDVTITPSIERERARERDRQRELDMETVKERPRQMTHRLPTPQFSSSPMIPPDRMQPSESQSDLDLSSTVQGDDYSDDHGTYDNVHDGRSSRAGHRFDDVQTRQLDKDEVRRRVERTDAQLEAEDQDETESYTPRSHHANLPQVIGGSAGPSTERVVYNTTQLHFRPRTASSDTGGMVNLDAAMIHDTIERLQQPIMSEQSHSHHGARSSQIHQQFDGLESPFTNTHAHVQHAGLSPRVPTADEIRAMVNDSRAYEAWRHAHSLIRPGAPIPPTPPNATTLSSLSYAPPSLPSLSPPPPRSTPYPYSYQYQHLIHRSQDPQQLMHHMQQQQAQQMQLLASNGMQTDSTFSPSSTPYPPYDYSPFLPEHFRRPNGDPSMSLRSSPSHLPVALPLFTPQRLNPKRKSLRRTRGSRELVSKLPPRGESTEPRETSPESSDGEEIEEGEYEEFNDLAARLESGASSENVATERGGDCGGDGGGSDRGEDDEEWIDEDEDDEDDLLHLEYHPNYVVNPDRRRKRWELKWDALVKAVRSSLNICFAICGLTMHCASSVPGFR